MKKKSTQPFEILDCTIRDGGYLNNWNFEKKLIKEVYRNVSRSGVNFIEIGFKNQLNKQCGIWHSLPEEVMSDLLGNISGAKIALMVDEGKEDLQQIPNARNSLVKLYRITAQKHRVTEAIKLCEIIKARAYQVSLQLMAIANYTKEDFDNIFKTLCDSDIDYIYFADSYGSLLPQDIEKYIQWLKPTGKKIGFHPHNNLQLAFANTLEAIRHNIDIVDGTVYGMGRGAGNLPLEVLIIYLEKTLRNEKYNSKPILDLIDRYFIELSQNLRWGYNLPHMLSGTFEVHPNYARDLVEAHEYNIYDITKALEFIKEINPIGFDKGVIEQITSSGFIGTKLTAQEKEGGDEDLSALSAQYPVTYRNRHQGKDFLVLANGPSLKEQQKEIKEFINIYNPIVLGANYLGDLFVPQYHGFSNKKRFIKYIDTVNKQSKLLISSSFEDDFIAEYVNKPYERLLHLNQPRTDFDIIDGIITSNCRTVSILLTAVSIVMGAKRIFIAGLDGYKHSELLSSETTHFYKEVEETQEKKSLIAKHDWNEAMLESINEYLLKHNREGLHILTPTSYKSFYHSVYNWV
ncbi:MAG: hypothetical protein H6755_07255 [Candidatus Omnitrophica bacterium]|nr:aldolase catalytic domain-containing protein [Candidatus Omnitrophota bacterium]MCB9748189.1 hypothetical protein [Candidatus Omnitrophota bacterium]